MSMHMGAVQTPRESALTTDFGEKKNFLDLEVEPVPVALDPTLSQLSYIPNPSQTDYSTGTQ